MQIFFFTLRTLWTLPTTSVGLTLALLNAPFGGRFQLRRGVLESHGGLISRIMSNPPFRPHSIFLAITFGDCILGRSPAALDIARDHEHVHVRQAHLWGPFFLPAYLAASAYLWARKKDPYLDNPFEIQAYNETGPN